MAPGPDLRIGDADRDAVAARLRESYAQGRLTLDEFNERLSAALAATTERELSQVTRDLPHPVTMTPPVPRGVPGSGRRRSGYDHHQGYDHPRSARRRRFFPVLAVLALLWLLISLSPLRLFPVPGKLAIVLLVLGLIRGMFRRVFGRGRF
jgi:Domain of unknown function (DUF1707)